MVEIFGKNYFIDLDAITDKCRTGNKIKEEDGSETTEINIFKYEIIKLCLDRVLDDFQEVDDELGAFAQKDTSISFRMAFNTLIKNEIIIDEDE